MSEVAQENSIYVSAKAKAKVLQLMQDAGVTDDASYFLRVGVVGGGCSGLSYKLDFDNEVKPRDKDCYRLKKLFILSEYRIGIFRWLKWKRLLFQ